MGTHKLLPCPFCGASDVLVDDDPAFATVYCENCGAKGAPSLDHNEAAEAWNRRSDRAAHIAGLREAAEWHEAEAEKVQPSWPALASIEVPDAEALAIRRDVSGHNRWSAMVFRARITALEEEGKT